MKRIAEIGLERWHAVVREPSESRLDDLLAADVVFHSPIVHSPQLGPALAKLYLMAAFQVLAGGGKVSTSERKFRYVREIVGERDAVLEFTTELEGVMVNGVDMIRWNDDGKIVDFKVMLRPLKAIQTVHAHMGQMLEEMKPTPGV